MEILEVNNQSASANCSWYGTGQGNLTWTVDGEEVSEDTDEVKDNNVSSVITLEWEKVNKTAGDTVLLSCIGESGGVNNNTGAWVSASQVMETIMVPSNNNQEETTVGSEKEDGNSTKKQP